MAKKQNQNEEINKVESTEKKQLNFQVVKEDLEKWNFQDDTKRVFVGKYKRTENFNQNIVDVKTGEVTQKPFTMYVFEEYETGKRFHIDSSHTIQKHIEERKATPNFDFENTVFAIEFLGKTVLKDGKPLNQYQISEAKI